jgi:hypothetical protein
MSVTHETYGTFANLGAWRFSRHLLKTLMDLNSSMGDLALKAPIESRFGCTRISIDEPVLNEGRQGAATS